MADAPYTPDTEDVEVYFALGLVEYSPGNGYDLNAAHDGFRRWLAAHVADEVERLAEDVAQMENGWVSREWGSVVNKLDVMNLLRARAAEIREEQTDGQ